MTKKFLTLILVAVAMVFASCSKDKMENPSGPTHQDIESKIIGHWIVTTRNGQEYLTNEQATMEFHTNHTCYSSASRETVFEEHFWAAKLLSTFKVTGNIVTMIVDGKQIGYGEGNDVIISMRITEITKDSFTSDLYEITTPDGKTVTNTSIHVYQRVKDDFSKDVIGLWEGDTLYGEETYGNAEARIEYHEDGSYTYFKKYADIWCPSENVNNEYVVDGNWLATRWRPQEGADYNYEWWEINYVKDGQMKWYALRENEKGERFTTAFIWNKVDCPTEEQYKSMILGEWKNVGNDMYWFKDGKVIEKGYRPYPEYQIQTYNPDGSFTWFIWNNEGELYYKIFGHYEIQGSVMTFYIEGQISEGEETVFPEPILGVLAIHAIDKDNCSLVHYVEEEGTESGEDYDHVLQNLKLQRP